jgi:hypothetical protein
MLVYLLGCIGRTSLEGALQAEVSR